MNIMVAFLKLTSDLDGTPTYIRADRIDAIFTKQILKDGMREPVTCIALAGQRKPAAVTESAEMVLDMIDAAAAGVSSE